MLMVSLTGQILCSSLCAAAQVREYQTPQAVWRHLIPDNCRAGGCNE
nr:MAG TPA: hypothetical protein [Caudoviricetes sp.]